MIGAAPAGPHLMQPAQVGWRRWVAPLLVLLGTTLIFAPMLYLWRDEGDFEPHRVYIERMLAGDTSVWGEVPNWLYHVPIVALERLLPQVEVTTIVVLVALAWYWLLALVIYALLRRALLKQADDLLTMRGAVLTIISTWALTVVTPVFLFTLDNMYFGYLNPYVYHNPTMIPVRPTSILLFAAAVQVYIPQQAPSPRWRRVGLWLAVALLTWACILGKPSFVLTLLPALGLMTLAALLRWRTLHWGLLVMGISLPAVALLGYQALTFTAGGLEFSPLLTFDLWAYHYNPVANTHLLLKFIMSILFPLVIYGLYWPQARRDTGFNLAWACLLAGVAWTYFFVDSGDRAAGNLVWNGQSAVLVLYLAAALFWLRQNRWLNAGQPPAHAVRWWISAGVFGLHLTSGIIWYVIHAMTPWPQIIYWWW